MEDKTIVIIGGTFNPPTIAHNILAKLAIGSFNAEKGIFVPVGDKYGRKRKFASAEHRFNMLKESVRTEEKQEVSDIEIKAGTQLTTYQTLSKMQELYPNHKLVFVMGSDNLIDLKTWENYEELLKNFKFAILKREEDDIENIINSDKLLTKYRDSIVLLDFSENMTRYISSSIVRRFPDLKTASIFLKKEVAHYIENNKLYYFD